MIFAPCKEKRGIKTREMQEVKAFRVHALLHIKTPSATMAVSLLRCSYLRYTQVLASIDAKMSHFIDEASLYTNFGVHRCQNVSIRK